MTATASAQTPARAASSPDAPARRERNRAILRSKQSGETWRAISKRFGISERQCRRAARSAEVLSAEESRLERLDGESLHRRILRTQSIALDVFEAEMEFGDNSNAKVGASRAASAVAADLRESALWAGLLLPPEQARGMREWGEIARGLLDGVEDLGVELPDLKAVLERELGFDFSENGSGP